MLVSGEGTNLQALLDDPFAAGAADSLDDAFAEVEQEVFHRALHLGGGCGGPVQPDGWITSKAGCTLATAPSRASRRTWRRSRRSADTCPRYV